MSIYDQDPDTGLPRPYKAFENPPELPDQAEVTPSDPTEQTRRDMLAAGQPQEDLASDKGQTWTTAELQRDFEVTGFMAPIVVVKRRSDGKVGSLEFTYSPRVYFAWKEDRP